MLEERELIDIDSIWNTEQIWMVMVGMGWVGVQDCILGVGVG